MLAGSDGRRGPGHVELVAPLHYVDVGVVTAEQIPGDQDVVEGSRVIGPPRRQLDDVVCPLAGLDPHLLER